MIKRLLLTLLLLFNVSFAADTGWLDPSSTTGTSGWNNPSNAFTSNNSDATITGTSFGNGFTSGDLEMASFSPGIPAGSTIDGIEVGVECLDNGFIGSWDISKAKLATSGTEVGNDKGGPAFADPEAYVDFGGTTDTWGYTWTVSEANNIGFVMQATNNTGFTSGTPDVDHIRIKIHYTEGSGTTLHLLPLLGVGK